MWTRRKQELIVGDLSPSLRESVGETSVKGKEGLEQCNDKIALLPER